MKLADLVRDAKDYDFRHRPAGKYWKAVPDSQVARLLMGARLALTAHRVEAAEADKEE